MEDGSYLHEKLTPELQRVNEADDKATPLVLFSTLVVICGSFAWGFAMTFTSPVQSAIMEDLDMSVGAYSVFGSILTIGGVIGSLVNGKLTDFVGRRGAMWISELFFLAGWFAIAFTQVAWLLDLGRVLMGIAIGINNFVIPTYIVEITPKNSRGALTYCNQFMSSCGASLVLFLGTIISWRSLALVGSIPCILHAVGVLFIPESPRWLAKMGRDIQFKATLQRLRGKHADIYLEAASIEEYIVISDGHSKTRLLDLFQRRYARPLSIGVLLMLLPILVGSSGIGSFLSSIFEQAGFSANIGQISIAVIQIPCILVAVLLTDKCGRRPLLMVSVAGVGLSCLLVGLAFSVQNMDKAEDATSILVYIGIMGFYITSSVGIAGLPWVIVFEIYPMDIKAVAGSMVTLTFWTANAVVTYAFNFAMAWSSAGTFFFFCGVCFVAFIMVAKFLPETKGRTLEEVQESLIGVQTQAASSI